MVELLQELKGNPEVGKLDLKDDKLFRFTRVLKDFLNHYFDLTGNTTLDIQYKAGQQLDKSRVDYNKI